MIDLLNSTTLLAVLAAVAAYTVYGALYRLYLSPIAKFPGPKLAALTFWYEIYYDVYPNRGQYTLMYAAMHEKYGPIVRINPLQLHVSTPEFYDTLYSITNHVDKCWQTYGAFDSLPSGMFMAMDHDLHRVRRAGVSQYFSIANVKRLQPVVEAKMEIFLQRLRGLAATGEVSRLVPMTSAFSSDVIMMYCFGQDMDKLQSPDFDGKVWEEGHEMNKATKMFGHYPWLFKIARAIPEPALLWLGGPLATVTSLRQLSRDLINKAIDEKKNNPEMGAHRTIFHELLSSNLAPAEKSIERLSDEATGITFAAGETIAWTLAVTTYYLLSNPTTLRKLKLELQAADPELVRYPTADRLPYLTAVIREGLRLSYGVPGMLPRVIHKPLILKDGDHEWTIPAGTSVGMSSYVQHHNERIFPDSNTFNPERWIENPRLDRYLVAFSKGTRQCLGMNLANAEMYLWLTSVYSRFGSKEVRFENDEGVLELVDTDFEDVQLVEDRFVPAGKEGRGVQIRVSR